MAKLIITSWRDIPAQITVKAGRRNIAKRILPERFEKAIDMCAMRVGAKDDDAYLAEWRKSDPVDVSDDIEVEAEKAMKMIDETYDMQRLKQLIEAEGFEKA